MTSRIPAGGRLRLMVLAVGLGGGLLSPPSSPAGDGPVPRPSKAAKGHPKHPGPGFGTLGYGPPGPHPGFPGFGLGYHPGYGYGGQGLGVGAEGGYPFYGGPGYPHPWPVLRRLGPITPFCYFGGPGYPTADHPNYYGDVGPLVPDQPVVTVEDPLGYSGDYGLFTGAIPDAEAKFAPFSVLAATGGSNSGVGRSAPANPFQTIPGVDDVPGPASLSRNLGIEAEPVTAIGAARGLKVVRVIPGSPSEKAGLRAGDIIESVNGHVTEQPTNLAWIVANASPERRLRIKVRAVDGTVRDLTVNLP